MPENFLHFLKFSLDKTDVDAIMNIVQVDAIMNIVQIEVIE